MSAAPDPPPAPALGDSAIRHLLSALHQALDLTGVGQVRDELACLRLLELRTRIAIASIARLIADPHSSPTCRRHPRAVANSRNLHRAIAGSVAAVSAVPVPLPVAVSVLRAVARSRQQDGAADEHLTSRLYGNHRPGLLVAAGLPGHADAEAELA
jgi:hypothetical protein